MTIATSANLDDTATMVVTAFRAVRGRSPISTRVLVKAAQPAASQTEVASVKSAQQAKRQTRTNNTV